MPKVTLSFKDHLGVGLGCVLTLYRTAFSLIAFPFQRSKGPALLKHHLSFIFFRAFLGSFSPRGLASIVPSTDEVYQNTLEAEGLKPESISLPDGTRVHLMGDSSAERVLLFFHGGGYIMPAVAGHFQLLASTLRQIKRKGGKLNVLFLEHDLAVVSPYPRQLQQAAALLDYTLTTLGKKPEQIILAGDSAGGNLALALLSHILHPHPKVSPVKFEGKLASLALLSPWVTFDTKSKSMVKNQYKDTLAVHSLEKWSSTFRGEAALDAYLEPLEAPKDWFERIPVEKALVMAGSDEVFADDIQKFGERLKPVLPLTTLEVVKDEAHDHLVLGFLLNGPERKRFIFQDWISESVNSGVL